MTLPPAASGTVPDLRLPAPAVTGWLAAWWATGASLTLAFVASAVAAVSALLLAWVAKEHEHHRRWVAPAALCCAAAVAVLGSTGAQAAARNAGPLPHWAQARAIVEVRGVVVTDPQPLPPGPFGGPPRLAVRIDTESVTARGVISRVQAPILVLAELSWAHVSAGSQVVFAARLSVAQPGDDTVALASALGAPRQVQPGSWPWRVADVIRAGLRTACQGLPAEAGGLLPSLVVGDTSTLSPAVHDDLRTAGLTHLTAVSGANLAIVIGCLLWITTAAGVRRLPRLVLALTLAAGFVVLARPQPSVLRAAAMGAIALLGLIGGRRPRGVPVLCAAVLVLLVGDPWLARSAGFALSTAATAGLLLLAPVWAKRWGRRLPRPMAVALAAPAAAQAVCGPIVVLLTPAVSTVAIPANLLAEPAVAPATVLGVIAAVLSPIWPWGAHLLAMVAAAATGWIVIVAHRAATLPAASVAWPPGLSGALLLGVLTAVIIAFSVRGGDRTASPGTTSDRVPERSAMLERRLVLRALIAFGAVGAGWLGAAFLPGGWRRLGGGEIGSGTAWPPGPWCLAMCDVGQGDALVLRSGADRAVVIDVGPDPELIDLALSRLGIRQIDLLVLTHHHADHVEGLSGALRDRQVNQVLVSPLAEPAEKARHVQALAAAAGVPMSKGVAGMSGRVGEGGWSVSWRILAPRDSPLAANLAATANDHGDGTVINESSIVTVLEITSPQGIVRVLALGDLEVEGQQHLAMQLRIGTESLGGPIDIVKMAHHGSAKQDPRLYQAIAAQVALIGVGIGNDYGHPAPSALAMIQRSGAATFRTDRDGSTAVQAAGSNQLVLTPYRQS